MLSPTSRCADHPLRAGAGGWYLTRLAMSCCAADSGADLLAEPPTVAATSVQLVPAPERPYLLG